MYCIEVRNRKIEQFLYLHGVDFTSQTKDQDGMTVWRYADTEETKRIIDEYFKALAIRQRQKTEKRFGAW